jgi:hypothetical protein
MSASFRVATLSGDQVPQAFPLIQAIWPEADLASWRSFVQFFNRGEAAGKSGVLAVRDPADYIWGILAYRLDRDLRKGLVLTAQLFVAVDLTNTLRTAQAVVDVAEKRAAELGCTGVQIHLHKDRTGLASRLRALGLSSDASLFWKKIEPAQGRS